MQYQDSLVLRISGKLEASTISVSFHEYLNMMTSVPTIIVTYLIVWATEVVRPSEIT